MSLEKKIQGFINFSSQRNFAFDKEAFLRGDNQSANKGGVVGEAEADSRANEGKKVLTDREVQDKVEAEKARVDAAIKENKPAEPLPEGQQIYKDTDTVAYQEKPEVEEYDSEEDELPDRTDDEGKLPEEKLGEEVRAAATTPQKLDLKVAAQSTEDKDAEIAALKAKIAKLEGKEETEVAQTEAKPNPAEELPDLDDEETETPEETPAQTEEVSEETGSETGAVTGGEAAAIAAAEAKAKADKVPDYNGAKVADAFGHTYTIVKRADGYYLKGSNRKVLDADGNPTAKYRTLGNALKSGMNVNDYVKSKGGWAKYNKELKSKASA